MWQQFLVSTVPDLRVAVYVLAIANLVWLLPLGAASLARDRVVGFPNAEMAIPVAAIVMGLMGFQHGYLFGDVPKIPHWSDAVNLLLICVGLILLTLFRALRWLDQIAIARKVGNQKP